MIEPPFWSHQFEAQAVRTVAQLDVGVDVYPADADTAAALEVPLKGELDGEVERGVAWFGRYCAPGLERYVEWRGPHDEAFDSLDTEYGSHCHGFGNAVEGWVARRIAERCDHYRLYDDHIEPVCRLLILRKN